MQLDPLRTQQTVDAKTAEEALALAIRLQQERGERIPIEELQKTADEAGIDRHYLETALHQIRHKDLDSDESLSPSRRRRVVVMAAAMAAAIGAASIVTLNPVAVFILMVVLVSLAVTRKRNRRRF